MRLIVRATRYWTYGWIRFILRVSTRQRRTAAPGLPGRKNSNTVKTQSALATLGAALILAGAPALASAADAQTGPIQIDAMQTYGFGASNDDVAMDPQTARISFTNEYASPATEVVLVLYSGGVEAARYDDLGSFAKGVTIDHTFPDSASGVQSVAVAKATFADGTTWQNPSIPNEQQPAIVGAVQAIDPN